MNDGIKTTVWRSRLRGYSILEVADTSLSEEQPYEPEDV